jgi:phytoene dehydrogenase-like protein
MEAGGAIHYETPAKNILIKEGAVEGVRIRGGKTFPARAVVSNASAMTTFNKMLPPGAAPSQYLGKLAAYKPSISSFIVWLGLNDELRGKIHGSGIHVASGKGPKADYESCMRGLVDQGSFSVSVYDNIFPGYSAPGTSTVMLLFLCGYEPWRKYEKAYRAGQKDAYNREKDRWTDILIKRSEEAVIPNLTAMIRGAGIGHPAHKLALYQEFRGRHLRFRTIREQRFHESHREQDPHKRPVSGRCLGESGRRICRCPEERTVRLFRKFWRTGGRRHNMNPMTFLM